jgi:hypothetical protein
MLFQYQQQVQRLIGDAKQQKVAPNDLVYYINAARRQVAELTQSVRVLTPIWGTITTITLLTHGSGYTSPVVTVTPPDSPGGTPINPSGVQATATATLSGGSITAIVLTNPGDGYFQPTVTITDPTGSGATASAAISPITQTVINQEVYNFSQMPLGVNTQGVASIFAIKSVTIIFEDQRFFLPCYSFSTYQAWIRKFPRQYYYVPTVMGQHGQGANGTLYMYPLPSQAYQFEADAFCLPVDLVDDTTYEAIPQPWTDAVPYFAAYLAFLELQDANSARGMLELFDKHLLRQSTAARPGRASNPFGRW